MAGGGKDLIANIIINGRTTDGFSRMSRQLSQMAQQVDQFGSGVRRFETESLSIYQDYETNMLAAKAALSAQYRNAGELNKVMSTLDVNARKWASTTIFHTDDVAQAINEASHAGWDLEQQMEGIPRAMTLAQAGGLDLSTGLDYLVKGLNATGTEFKDSGQFIDQWTMAANSSATNIDEIGQALQSLGSAGRFADSTAELFTMLGTLANVGTTGSQAGTLLRSSMIRLIAPTDKALKTMNALAVTEEELGEVSANMAGLTEANQLLEEAGFSAYDSNGDLKGFLDIYSDLYSAVSGMEDVDKNKVLSAIFPTRTMSTALTLLQGAADSWNGLYESILGSDGYAQQNADIMMSGLMGATETLKSKWEEFQRMFGSVLAPWVEDGAEILGDIIDGLNAIDPNVLSGLAGAATALATAGPAMMLFANGAKLISLLGTNAGRLTLVAMALSGIAAYVDSVEKAEWLDNFGDLSLDLDGLSGNLAGMTSELDTQRAAVDKWADAVDDAFGTYLDASGSLMERIVNGNLTDHTFTPEEIQQLNDLGDTMITAVYDGIDNAEARDLSLIDMMFGSSDNPEDAQVFSNMASATDARYAGLYAEAESLGAELRSKMTEALRDSVINDEEQEAIDQSVGRINEVMARIAEAESKQEYYRLIAQAQRISATDLAGAVELTDKAFEQQRQDAYRDQDETVATAMANYDYAMEEATTPAEREEARRQRDAAIAAAERVTQRRISDIDEAASGEISGMLGASFRGTGLGDAWRAIEAIAKSGYYSDGTFLADAATPEFWQGIGVTPGMIDQLNTIVANPNFAPIMSALSKYKGSESLAGRTYGTLADILMDPDKLTPILEAANWAMGGGRPEGIDAETQALIESGRRDFGGSTITLTNGSKEQISNAAFQLAMMNDTSDAATIMTKFEVDEETANAVIAERDAMQAAYDVPLEAQVTVTNAYEAGLAAKSAILSAIGTLNVRLGFGGGGGGGISRAQAYANGGRATEASIFGEAGAEWAIPEAHTARTGELLNAARAASGFTWGELIERYGGLNGGTGQTNITYAPVIHAANADGVAGVLEKDKDRMRRVIRDMMREQREMDGAAAFA
jgi:TP901 family phage tail tape measure protein